VKQKAGSKGTICSDSECLSLDARACLAKDLVVRGSWLSHRHRRLLRVQVTLASLDGGNVEARQACRDVYCKSEIRMAG
jgi:hypothetical protein